MPWRLTRTRARCVRPGRCWIAPWRRASATASNRSVDLCRFGLPDHYRGFCGARTRRWRASVVTSTPSSHATPPASRSGQRADDHGDVFGARRGVERSAGVAPADYMRALAHVTRANVEALSRLDADRDAWWIGAEGFTARVTVTPDDEPAADEARALDRSCGICTSASSPHPRWPTSASTSTRPPWRASVQLAGRADRVVAGHDFSCP